MRTINITDVRNLALAYLPIGSIIAWHKNFPNTPPLPDGWMECNGQVVTDPESPYYGQTLPNLNGERRFLRGNIPTGATGGSETHNHTGKTGWCIDEQSSVTPNLDYGNWDHRHVIYTDSNLPPYMDIVWIIKIK
jgi:hypothetical protein